MTTLATAEIDALFAPWDRPDSPGCALGIVQDGELVYARGYGAANLEYGQPITASSVFHVASVSKQFTARAVAVLAREGRLRLDDDIRHHLPELPDFGTPLTVRQLLNHTSGLRDQWDLLALAGWRPDDLKTDADVLDLATRQRELNFAPGAEYLYSNTGYTLAGLIVTRLTGQSLRAFTHERFFAPAGMTRTHFHDNHSEIVPDRAYAYVPKDAGYQISIPAFDTVGATSLFTTVEDLARWVRQLDQEWARHDPFLAEVCTAGVLNNGTQIDYALGLRLDTHRGERLIEHSGADAGYRAHFLWFPDKHLGIIVLCNLATMQPSTLARQVADCYLGNAPDEVGVPISRTAEELAPLAGIYQHPGTGFIFRIVMKDGVLTLLAGGEVPLTPLVDGRFQGPSALFRFTNDAANQRQFQLLDAQGNATGYVAVPTAVPTATELAAYVGTYRCPELDVAYTIAQSASGLTLQRRKFADRALVPTVADGFTDDRCQLDFTRGDNGRPDGFGLSTMRVRRLRFVRT